jgi:hypothetical protein
MPPSQPHWKIATTTPCEAPIERRFMSAACSGMTSERKTSSSSSAESSTTTPMKSASLLESTCMKSIVGAFVPPTSSVVPEVAASGGSVLWRSTPTSPVVARACGAERGRR